MSADIRMRAEIYRELATVFTAMDPRNSWALQNGETEGWIGQSYGPTESAIWDGFSSLGRVMDAMASSYEKKASEP